MNKSKYRYIFIIISLIQVLASFLFYKYSMLVFLLEERSEIYPVREMASIGSDEDFGIIVGIPLFLVLVIFNFIRIKNPIRLIDNLVIYFILFIQLLYLFFIETGSFVLTIQQEYGWILALWLINYCLLWFFNSVSFVSSIK